MLEILVSTFFNVIWHTQEGNSAFLYLCSGNHSTLTVCFHLQRHMGDFIIQVYGPCSLLVVISWVSFWLNREATSERISLGKCILYSDFTRLAWQIFYLLGITTVLTITFLGLEARKDLPKVTYPTALDYFVFISFMYIFCTVVQVNNINIQTIQTHTLLI